jgi:hypothetical protein
MKNRVLALTFVFSLFVCSSNLMANERRGAELVITKTDGQETKGELIAVKPLLLLLLDSQTSADVSVEIGEIAVIKIIKKSKALTVGAIGFGGGALLGLGFGTIDSCIINVL